jgi:hypothetical protein
LKSKIWVLGLLSAFSAVAFGEDFETFINARLAQRRLHLPSLLSGGIYKPEPVNTSSEDFSELYKFYKSKLPIRDDDQFFTEKLAPIFRMAQGRPVRPYYNDSLVWVKRGNQFVYLLRPVDTVTGCDSSCAPIVYHLVMDGKGVVNELLEEPSEPLRKIFHTPMDDGDKKKLLQILKRLPEAFRGMDHPDRLTNTFTAFPPQTWTFFAPAVVEGAAYTSYRIYESALQVQQRLRNKDNEVDQLTDLYGTLFRIHNLASAQSFIEEITSSSARKKMGPNTEEFAVSAFYEVLVYLAQEKQLTPEALKKFLKSRQSEKNEIQHQCSLIRDFFPYPELARVAIDQATLCPKEIRDVYSDLATGKFWDTSTYQTPPFLLKDEKSFYYFLKKFRAEKNDSTVTKRMTAEALVFFPDTALAEGIRAPEHPTEEEKHFANDAELNYRETIKRKFFNPWSEGALKGTFTVQGKSPAERELPKSSIIVFFAPWCPHCQKLLHGWGAEKKLDPRLKDHVLLVESFATDSSWNFAQSFCKDAGLDSRFCKKNLWILDKEKSQPLIKTLGLYTIPRIVITDSKGQVVVFDYIHDADHPLQSNIELLYLWQEANKDRSN